MSQTRDKAPFGVSLGISPRLLNPELLFPTRPITQINKLQRDITAAHASNSDLDIQGSKPNHVIGDTCIVVPAI